jgi:hypothetical protein
MDISKLLPSLPEWLSLPIIIVVLIVTLWPKIIQMVQELSSTSRAYAREKQRLELLKLRYEIEAIKKEKSLEKIDEEELFPNIEQPTLTAEKRLGVSFDEQLTFWWRFAYGAAGSLLPIFLNVLLIDIQVASEIGVGYFLGMIVRLIIFAVVSGIGSALLAKGNANKQMCFLIGLSISLLFSLLLTGTAQNSVHDIPNVS